MGSGTSAQLRALRTAPWTHSAPQLFRVQLLALSVIASVALACVAVGTRSLFASSVANAALAEDIRACPVAEGLLIERPGRFPPGGDAANAVSIPDATEAIASATQTLPGVTKPILTVFAGTVTLRLGARSTSVQLVARDGFERHLHYVARTGLAHGIMLSTGAAKELSARPGTLISAPQFEDAQIPLSAVFEDLQETTDNWWCSLRPQIVGPVLGGNLPFALVDLATLERLLAPRPPPALAAWWEIHPIASKWTIGTARKTVPALEAVASRSNNPEDPLGKLVGENRSAANTLSTITHASQASNTAASAMAGAVFGAIALSVLALGNAVRIWIRRQTQELATLRQMGVGPSALSLKVFLEFTLPILVGVALSVPITIALVAGYSPPSISDGAATLHTAIIIAVTGAVLLAVAFVLTTWHIRFGQSRLRSTEPRSGVFTITAVLLLLAAIAYYETNSRGTTNISTQSGARVDPILVMFPMFLVAGLAGVVAVAVTLPRRSRGAGRVASVLRITRRRLAASARSVSVLIIAIAAAVGLAMFSASYASTVRATAAAKATLGQGAPDVLTTTRPTTLARANRLAHPSAVVTRTSEDTGLVAGHEPADVLGIVSFATFAKVAVWDASFADSSLRSLLGSIVRNHRGGVLDAIAVGNGLPDHFRAVLRKIDGHDTSVPVQIVGRARFFPGLGGAGSTRPLIVVAADGLASRSIDATQQIWTTGYSRASLAADARRAGLSVNIIRVANPNDSGVLESQIWALRILTALSWAAFFAGMTLFLVYIFGAHRDRALSDVLVKTVGGSRPVFRITLNEGVAIFGVAWLIGAIGAWIALRLTYLHTDALPYVDPPALLRANVGDAVRLLAASLIISVLAAWAAARRSARADVGAEFRNAA